MTETYDMKPINAVLGAALAVSGAATFMTTYNAASKINELYQPCEDDPELMERLKVRSYVFLAIGVVSLIIAIVIAFMSKNKKGGYKPGMALAIGFGLTSLLFLLTGGNNMMETHMHRYLPMGLAWGLFIILLAIAIYRQVNDKPKKSDTSIITSVPAATNENPNSDNNDDTTLTDLETHH